MKTERFCDRLKSVVQRANKFAQENHHEYIGTEHVLYGIIEDGLSVGTDVLRRLGVDLAKAKRMILQTIVPGPPMVTMGKLPQTPALKKAFEEAELIAEELGHQYLNVEHAVWGLIKSDCGTVASDVLNKCGATPERYKKELIIILGAFPRSDRVKEVTAVLSLMVRCRESIAAMSMNDRSKGESDLAESYQALSSSIRWLSEFKLRITNSFVDQKESGE